MQEQLNAINDNLKSKLAKQKTRYNGTIHHYTSPSGLENILTNSKIWFSNTRFLNDSTENNYIYSLFPKYSDNKSKYNLDKDFFKLIDSIAQQYLCRDFCIIDGDILWAEHIFVSSFSKDPDNLILWNYYTKNADNIGYNITFQNDTFEMNPPFFKYIYGEIIYNKKTQEELLDNLIIQYNNFYKSNKSDIQSNIKIKREFIKQFIDIVELYNIFFKHPKYKDEKEYRWAIYDIKNYAGLGPKYRIHKGIFIPYIEIPFEKNQVLQVGVCPTTNKELLKQSINLFLLSKGYEHTHTWVSSIPIRY